MKTRKAYLMAVIFAALAVVTLPSCKKGDDDPVVSLKSRKDRITNTWTLNRYEENGVEQSLDGTFYEYDVRNNGTLTETKEGEIFGFETRNTEEGTWSFINDDEDLRVDLDGDITVYNIQRLASKELWLRENVDGDVKTYYFNAK